VSSSNYRVRRATLDDIGQLTAIWQSMRYPVEDLARRVTEFQIAEDAEGRVLGGVAMQILEKQGLIHSEAYDDFSHAEAVRPLLWERLNSLASNHGLLRIWTREEAPFWSRCGLNKPEPEALAKMPAPWRNGDAPWLTLKLRDNVEALLSADHEFAMFMQAEKQRTARTMQQAKLLKMIATLIAIAILVVAAVGIFMLIRRNPQILPH
jgi:N-acetylglutamate synthase-like GNAT family acetyltransferase